MQQPMYMSLPLVPEAFRGVEAASSIKPCLIRGAELDEESARSSCPVENDSPNARVTTSMSGEGKHAVVRDMDQIKQEEGPFAAVARRHGHRVNFDMSGLRSMRPGGKRHSYSPDLSETSGHHDPPSSVEESDYRNEPGEGASGVDPDNPSDLSDVPSYQSNDRASSAHMYHSLEDENPPRDRKDAPKHEVSSVRTYQSSDDAFSNTSGYHPPPVTKPAGPRHSGQAVGSDTSGHHNPSPKIQQSEKVPSEESLSNTSGYHIAPPPQVAAPRRLSRVHVVPGPQDYQVPSGGDPDNLKEPGIKFPGEFALRLHSSALVSELREYKTGFVRSTWDAFRDKLRRRQDDEETVSETSSASSLVDGRRFCISFAEVQRMRIRKLQCELVRHVVKMRREAKESEGWEETMKEYIKAIQDHDYMENRSKSSRDPFLATGEYALDNHVLKTYIDRNIANDRDTKMVDSLLPWEDLANHRRQHFESICGPRHHNIAKAWLAGFKERVLFAALGAAFLIGPMWLMVLQSWLYTTLIATTAFVAAFGLIMAYYLDEGKDVLASTAAYAAVLVVFVGTSTSSPTESAA